MRSSILAFSVVAGLGASVSSGSPVQADISVRVPPGVDGDPTGEALAMLGAASDLDPVGEGIMIGRHERLETPRGPVHVWTPRGYAPETAMTVVYVHGYGIDVDEAWWAHGLPEQFGHASINALFVACEAPQDPRESVHWRSLSQLLDTVAASGYERPRGRVAAIGHSGAYRTLEHWVKDSRLDTLVLLDAGYGHLWWVRQWILGKPHRRLIDIADDTLVFTDRLHRYLRTTTLQGFDAFADPERIERLARDRIVYVRSRIGHWNIATGAVALPSVLRILGAPPIDAP